MLTDPGGTAPFKAVNTETLFLRSVNQLNTLPVDLNRGENSSQFKSLSKIDFMHINGVTDF